VNWGAKVVTPRTKCKQDKGIRGFKQRPEGHGDSLGGQPPNSAPFRQEDGAAWEKRQENRDGRVWDIHKGA